jgi:hypothetical protein
VQSSLTPQATRINNPRAFIEPIEIAKGVPVSGTIASTASGSLASGYVLILGMATVGPGGALA